MNINNEVDIWREYIEKYNTYNDKKGRKYGKLIEEKELSNNATMSEDYTDVFSPLQRFSTSESDKDLSR